MNPKAREELIKSRGFCNYHFYKMHAVASNPSSQDGHGLALILKSVAEQIIEDVDRQSRIIEKAFETFTKSVSPWKLFLRRKGKQRMFSAKEFQKMLSAETSCPVCHHISSLVLNYIEEFTENLAVDDELAQLFDKSRGLCVPHYATAISMALQRSDRSETSTKKIISVEKRSFKQLESELAEYIEKQDYRFSEKERALLHDVIFRGVTKLVGKLGTKVRNQSER